jgi:acyl-CoA synthetase (AMP-forming)/AMP-acid ligase II
LRAADTVIEALLIRARVSPHALAYVVDGEAITYRALLDDVQDLAGRFAARGLERGNRCAIILPTCLDFIRVVYAIQFLGAVPVAINPDLPVEAVMRRLRLVRARLALSTAQAASTASQRARVESPCTMVSMDDLLHGARSVPSAAPPDPSAPAFLQLTSGTTGESRAAVISHRSLTASLTATADRLEMRSDDVLATWVPLHHDLGLVRYVFGAMLSGCPSHLSRPSIVNLRPWLAMVAQVRATITGGPDSAYRLAARTVDPTDLDLRSLRFAGNGGEVVRFTTIEQFERRFGLAGVVRPAYGLAEATLTVTSTAPGEALRVDAEGTVSCGRPVDGIELRIADADGRMLPTGSAGELLVRGAPVFDGYFDDEAATSRTLRDGWLHTGDVGRLDTQGHLFLKGRSRALIKRAGVTIAPREVEDAVDRVAGVCGSAAIGVAFTSASATEEIVVVAEVHARPGSEPRGFDSILTAIDGEVRSSVGWAPGRIVLVAPGTIPRTAAGKVRYDELRQMVTDIATSAGVLCCK